MSNSSNKTQPLLANPKSKSIILDFFISQENKKYSVDLYRSRILVGMSLSIGLALFLGSIYIWWGSDMGRRFQLIALSIMIPMSVLSILLTFAYKTILSYVTCANAVVFVGFAGVSVAIYIAGGPIHSPAQFIITFPVVLSFCLLGRYSGLAWTAATLTVQSVMGGLVLYGFDFPNLVEQGNIDEVKVLIYIMTILTTAVVLVIYDGMQSLSKTERHLQEQRYLFLATHDALTRLPNRLLFFDQATLAVSRANKEKSSFAILYLDLNRFKPVNDDYGHEAGDLVLQVVAERLTSAIRETDVIARLGGDEFAIITGSLKSKDNVNNIAQKIIREIEKPIKFKDQDIVIGTSIGISFYPKDATDIEELISQADTAMYAAKNTDNHFVRFDSIATSSDHEETEQDTHSAS